MMILAVNWGNAAMIALISILLVFVMCLTMCACAGETKSNEIELTLENYDDYLEFYASIRPKQYIETSSFYWLGAYSNSYTRLVENDFFTGYSGYFSATPVTPNYNFHNVTIKIRFTGNVLAILENSNPDNPKTTNYTFDFDDTFELNVGGTVKDSNGRIIDLPSNLLI